MRIERSIGAIPKSAKLHTIPPRTVNPSPGSRCRHLHARRGGRTGARYLTGNVDNEAMRRRATELARQVKGVREVVNNLKIDGKRGWWRWEDSNLRHGAYETPALPPELHRRARQGRVMVGAGRRSVKRDGPLRVAERLTALRAVALWTASTPLL